jgi:hypothetical protein
MIADLKPYPEFKAAVARLFGERNETGYGALPIL